jgi:hypothetical protein
MRGLSLAAAAIAAWALAAPVAAAQFVAPGYALEEEHFSAAPGTDDTIEPPGQDVPGISVQTHVPSTSAQGRGAGGRLRPEPPLYPQL